MSDEHHTATVVATYSRRMRLRLDTGNEVASRIKGKRLRPVCGDRVMAEKIDNETDWLITRIEDRRNVLTRPNLRGSVETLAANIDALLIVAAVAPLTDWFIVDRYIAAAELMQADPVVIFNKIDLLDGENPDIAELDEYRQAEIDVIVCSAASGAGMRAVSECTAGRTSIVVGQSGVGKSSLINTLIGDEEQKTAGISEKTGEGRHTTVNSVMIYLNNSGQIVDSPGVRDFSPALVTDTEAAAGFREVASAAQHCRFANCLHLREPGCAVKAAVTSRKISERRYESYRRLVNLTRKLALRGRGS